MTKHVARTEWTKADKQEAAIHYAVYGSLAKIERELGIPKPTSCLWKNKGDAVWVETVAQVQTEKSEEHRAVYVQLVDQAQEQVRIKLPEATAAQAMVIAGIATDKVRVHDGMPTSISGSQDNRALADVCKELSRTMRDHGVVSVQAKSRISHNEDKTEPK